MKRGDLIDGRYRLDAMIGAGGLGVVWRATQLDFDRLVAIKFLKHAHLTDVRRFEVEAQALARLQHPGCLTVHEFGHIAAGPYLVMEYVVGRPLSDLRGQRLSTPRLATIAELLLSAIDHAHREGVLHRDLKPENILLVDGPAGEVVKVLDFGLAKLAGRELPDITKTGEFMGTAAYMSPEQLRGSKDVGPPSDVYSLGVMLFELIAGRHPFIDGGTPVELGMAHLNTPVPEIIDANHPPALVSLVRSMLQKDPRRRPTALAARRQLESAVTPPTEASFRRRPPVAAILIALAVAVALAVGFVLTTGEPDRTAPSTPPPRALPVIVVRPAPADVEVDVVPVDARADAARTGCGVPAEPGPQRNRASMGLTQVPYWIDVPKTYDSSTPSPLLILLHHDRSSPAQMARDTGFGDIASEARAVIMGLETRSNPWRNSLSEELAEVERAIEHVRARLCIDESQVFVVGFGVGGKVALGAACQPWATAVAVASYTPEVNYATRCETAAPIMVIAPKHTQHAPFEGGPRCGTEVLRKIGRGSIGMAVPDFEAILRDRNGCAARGTQRRLKDGVCTAFADCTRAVTSCHIEGGHGWPGTTTADLMCDSPPSAFPSATEIWKFFQHK